MRRKVRGKAFSLDCQADQMAAGFSQTAFKSCLGYSGKVWLGSGWSVMVMFNITWVEANQDRSPSVKLESGHSEVVRFLLDKAGASRGSSRMVGLRTCRERVGQE